jgi:hypothetical protein
LIRRGKRVAEAQLPMRLPGRTAGWLPLEAVV